jgi:hypothetical protein
VRNKVNIEKVKDLKNLWDYSKKYNLHRRKRNENSKNVTKLVKIKMCKYVDLNKTQAV